LKPFEAQVGTTAAWFGQPGGGAQIYLGSRTVDQLISDEILGELH